MKGKPLFYCSYVIFFAVYVDASLKCYDGEPLTKNSSFIKNRNQILSSLGTNVTANDGFYNASVGHGSDRAYVLAMCRDGFDSHLCSSCVNWVANNLVKLCENSTEAFSWDDLNDNDAVLCLVRYSNRNIFRSMQIRPLDFQPERGQPNSPEFDLTWLQMMNQMIGKASSGNSSRRLKYYDVAKQSLGNSGDIYALMQCTPDISSAACNDCLKKCVTHFHDRIDRKQGGEVSGPSCFFRWALYDFYGAFDNITTLPSITKNKKERKSVSLGILLVTIVPAAVNVLIFIVLAYACLLLKKKYQRVEMSVEPDTSHMFKFNLGTVRTATDDFSPENELGHGGFGAVYKGKLPNGLDVAVKRLNKDSGQGEKEFKNEVLLLARLQHRNLVKLLGFCHDGDEKLLIYEFVSNSSLDHFLFDEAKRLVLTWELRYKIIEGIVRGILYLHEDSQLRIIHRDLKTSNILLDEEMCPKVSDFGLARLFSVEETRGETSRVVGTYGYMAPEYVRNGQFSVKSDVFSFGIMLLEMITGQKNSSFQSEGLPTYAWKSWSEGKVLDIVDPIGREGPMDEIMRCVHIALLCVQENAERRPTMNSVVLWLGSHSTCLPIPTTPAFMLHDTSDSSAAFSAMVGSSEKSRSEAGTNSFYEGSVTEIFPR